MNTQVPDFRVMPHLRSHQLIQNQKVGYQELRLMIRNTRAYLEALAQDGTIGHQLQILCMSTHQIFSTLLRKRGNEAKAR